MLFDTPRYYMFMEDDFRYCPHAFTATQYLIEKVGAGSCFHNPATSSKTW